MKNLYILLVTLFVFTFSNAQIGFQDHIIIDESEIGGGSEGESILVDLDSDGDMDVLLTIGSNCCWILGSKRYSSR